VARRARTTPTARSRRAHRTRERKTRPAQKRPGTATRRGAAAAPPHARPQPHARPSWAHRTDPYEAAPARGEGHRPACGGRGGGGAEPALYHLLFSARIREQTNSARWLTDRGSAAARREPPEYRPDAGGGPTPGPPAAGQGRRTPPTAAVSCSRWLGRVRAATKGPRTGTANGRPDRASCSRWAWTAFRRAAAPLEGVCSATEDRRVRAMHGSRSR